MNYANVTATLALFVALGGSSYAAIALPRNSVGSAQLRKGAVTGSKIRSGSITAGKVKQHSLLASDFEAGQLAAGPAGLRGAQGPTGEQGPPGPAGPVNVTWTTTTNGVTSNGTYTYSALCPSGTVAVGGGALAEPAGASTATVTDEYFHFNDTTNKYDGYEAETVVSGLTGSETTTIDVEAACVAASSSTMG
jgi:hypothetical protein